MNFNKLLSGNITKYQKEGFIMISVGIDVSKGKSTVCIMKPCGEILESPFDIGHTADELDSLISSSNDLMKKPVLLWKIQVTIIFLLRPIYLLTTFLYAV